MVQYVKAYASDREELEEGKGVEGGRGWVGSTRWSVCSGVAL